MLVDVSHRLFGDGPRLRLVAGQRPTLRPYIGHTAEFQKIRNAPRRVGAAAEAYDIDTVALVPVVEDVLVALYDIPSDAAPGDRREQLSQPTHELGRRAGSVVVGAEAGVVKGNLQRGVNRAVRPRPAGAV
jgi:hypothetical protein